MKKGYFLYILVLLLFTTISCGHYSADYPTVVKLNSFIAQYSIMYKFELVQAENNRAIYISPKLKAVYIAYNSEYPHTQRLYDSLCTRHNDLKYNNTASAIPFPKFPMVTTPNISKIKISCSVDFDASHPAGSSLNDIVTFMGYSFYPFIASGYKTTYDLTQYSLPNTFKEVMSRSLSSFGGKEFYDYDQFKQIRAKPLIPICKIVSDLSDRDLLLLYRYISKYYATNSSTISMDDYIGALYFEQTPETSGDYEITIELIGDNGETFQASITMNF